MFDFKSVIEECAHIAETEPKYPGLTLDRAGKIYKMALDLGRNDRSHEAAIQLIIRSTCEDTCRAIAERIRETKKTLGNPWKLHRAAKVFY